jgi:glycosyltransferase involved in cell wall biosynthesis
MSVRPKYVVATPSRSVCDDNAHALTRAGALRFLALGTRHGSAGVPPELTRLRPIYGLLNYAAVKCFSQYRAESLRFAMLPAFDRWVRRQLTPGDHIISSYGYANESFRWARERGGKTFLDGGNSHPAHFWQLLSEEHRLWNCALPPVSPQWNRRAVEMMPHVDYVLSPSSFVTRSFLERGFQPEQMLRNVYPVDLSRFAPAAVPRPKNRPLTIVSTGGLSLRKGAPYLLEALRLVHQRHPSARFLLTQNVADSATPIVAKYRDLPIDWAPRLPHAQLAARLQSADVFVLPSLEEGLVRTALEAMACGLPVVLTPNTGANDFVRPGVSGSVVPIRDARATADAILEWGERALASNMPPQRLIDSEPLTFAYFEREFIAQLKDRALL